MLIQPKDKVVDAVRAHLARTGGSQAALARQVGISPATLTNILKGAWDNIADKMFNNLASYLRMGDAYALVETSNLMQITRLCDNARTFGRMEMVSAPAGAGKTSSLKHYKLNNAETYYVLCQQSMSRRDLLVAIATELNSPAGGSIYAITVGIGEALREKGGALLILDDVGKLTDNKLHVIQQIYDLAEGAGIVLAGVNYAYDNLQKGVRKGKMGFPELVSRIAYTLRLSARPSAVEVQAIAQQNGIASDAYIKWLSDNCGDFRRLNNCIRSMQRLESSLSAAQLTELLKTA